MKLNNKGGATTAIIVILTILLVASLGYIGYDKFIAKDDKNNDTNVETVGYEEVKKLYDSIVCENNGLTYYGLYFKEKVDSSNMTPFITLVLRNYLKENNMEIYQWSLDPENPEKVIGVIIGEETKKAEDLTEKQGKITKENLINYAKGKYGVELTKNQIKEGRIIGTLTEVKDFGDYIVLGNIPAGGSSSLIYRDMINYEQNDKQLVIYDNMIYRVDDVGMTYLMTYISNSSADTIKTIEWNQGLETEVENYVETALKDGTAGSYKHTFTLGSDNTYHWVSSEKIN